MKKLECDFYFLSKVDFGEVQQLAHHLLPSLQKQADPKRGYLKKNWFGHKKFKNLFEICCVCNKFTFFSELYSST